MSQPMSGSSWLLSTGPHPQWGNNILTPSNSDSEIVGYLYKARVAAEPPCGGDFSGIRTE